MRRILTINRNEIYIQEKIIKKDCKAQNRDSGIHAFTGACVSYTDQRYSTSAVSFGSSESAAYSNLFHRLYTRQPARNDLRSFGRSAA